MPDAMARGKSREGAAVDYKYIIDSQGVDAEDLPDTMYMKENGGSPTIREAKIKGKEQKYYGTEQGRQNIQLKSLVEESEDFMATLYELHFEQVGDAKNVLEYRCREEFERVREFGSGFKWATGMGFTAPGIIKQLALIIQMDIFNKRRMGTAVQATPFTVFLREALEDARLKAKPKKLSTVHIGTGSQRPSLAAPEPEDDDDDDDDDDDNNDGERESSSSPVGGAAHLSDAPSMKCLNHYLLPDEFKEIAELIETHLEMIGTDVTAFIKDALRSSRIKLTALQNELYDRKQEQRIAFQANNMVEADVALCQCVEVLEKMIECVRWRLSQTTDGCSDAGTFQGNFLVHSDNFRAFLSRGKQTTGRLHEQLGGDMDKLGKKIAAETDKHKKAAADFAEMQDTSYATIQDYNQQQSRIWDEIRKLCTEVQKIGVQKAKEIQGYVARKEEEERRIREYTEYADTLNRHSVHLKKLQENVEVAQSILDETTTFYETGCEIIEGKNVEGELDALRERELKLYLDVYRQYVLMIGDLILRRRTRLQGVRRLIRNQEAQLELCQDSLDPHQDKYREDMEQQRVIEKEVAENLDALMARMRKEEEAFEPVERQLEEMDFDFTPPKFELNEVEQPKRDRLLGYSRQILNKEQDEVTKETLDLRRLTSNVRQGRDIITQRKQKRQARQVDANGTVGAQSADFGPSSPMAGSDGGLGARSETAPVEVENDLSPQHTGAATPERTGGAAGKGDASPANGGAAGESPAAAEEDAGADAVRDAAEAGPPPPQDATAADSTTA